MNRVNPRDLPGFKKKSFSLPYNGGEIWFEHLDGIYDNANLAVEKLREDVPRFSRPSGTADIGFVLDETKVTDGLIGEISSALLDTEKTFCRVCFIGTDRRTKRALKAALKNKTFALGFIDDFEKAKDWLINERKQ